MKRVLISIRLLLSLRLRFRSVPTVSVAELCILAGSCPGDLVFDPFVGVGTTALVAQQLRRNYFGIEINPEYIRLANERLATVQHRSQGVEAT